MGKGERAHLSWRGGAGGGGETFTHPEGRSQSLTSDLALKEGNLGEGEGEGDMSEQGEQPRSSGNKEPTQEARHNTHLH